MFELKQDLKSKKQNKHIKNDDMDFASQNINKYSNTMPSLFSRDIEKLNNKSFRNNNGSALPDNIKNEYEEKTGLSMEDVSVHYNSLEPKKFNASAYTYGTDIYISPGKESSLNHELVHVIQQKQGIVYPTTTEAGFPLNDSPTLEENAETGNIFFNSSPSYQPIQVVQCTYDSPDYLPSLPGQSNQFKRHHIIPKGKMEQLFDEIKNYGSPVVKDQIKKVLINMYNKTLINDIELKNKFDKDLKLYKDNYIDKDTDTIDFFKELLRWAPFNLVIGPSNRANDSGNHFDYEAYKIYNQKINGDKVKEGENKKGIHEEMFNNIEKLINEQDPKEKVKIISKILIQFNNSLLKNNITDASKGYKWVLKK